MLGPLRLELTEKPCLQKQTKKVVQTVARSKYSIRKETERGNGRKVDNENVLT